MPPRGSHLLTTIAIMVVVVASRAAGSDLPPDVVGDFTRKVQPLIVNKCAAGACHGGPTAHAPTFKRGPASGGLDRTHTLANMDILLDTIGTDRDPQRLITLLSGKHPATPSKGSLAATPLSSRERITLEHWLGAVRAAERGRRFDLAVQPAAATIEAPPKDNPFRNLLEAAATTQELPPPQEPQGVIFKKDDETFPEPPLAPSPPLDP
jgi:hypothetical protein